MKKYLLLLLVPILLAQTAMAVTVYRHDGDVTTVRGDAVAAANITVYTANTTTKVTLYADRTDALGTKTNPTYTDSHGRYYFYLPLGTYDVVISGYGITTYTMEDLNIGGVEATADGVFNIRDYGAIPDDGVDDSSFIQAAMDSAMSGNVAGSGVVYAPIGKYTIGTRLNIGHDPGIKLVGDGQGGTWFDASATLDTSILDIGILASGFSGALSKSNTVEIAHITFNNEAAPKLDAFIRIGDGRSLWIHDLDFRDGNDGLDSYGADFGILIDPSLGEDVGVTFSTFERLADSGSGCVDSSMIDARYVNDCTFHDIRVSKNATYGIMLGGGAGSCRSNTIYNIHAENAVAANTALVKIDHSAGSAGGISHTNIWGLFGAFLVDYGIELTTDGSRHIYDNNFSVDSESFATGATNIIDNGTGIYRNTFNGLSYNAGNPASAGIWSGKGHEGLRVWDTTNGILHQYTNGSWGGAYMFGSVSEPDTASQRGILWFDDTNGILKFYTGESWEPLHSSTESKTTSIWPMGTGASAGDTYTGGFYIMGAADNVFNPAVDFGTANSSYAAHFFVVTAAGATDTQLLITGTSITDAGVRTTSDTESMTLANGDGDTYYETTKKWVGEINIEKVDGTDRLVNYGFCKYWDNANKDFTVLAFEALWMADKTDAGFDVSIVHHKATGWTYVSGANSAIPPVIQSMSGTHVTERSCISGEPGAFKRTSSGVAIDGDGSEGILFYVTTTTTNVLDYGSIQIWYTD